MGDINKQKEGFFPVTISKDQAKDTGMAMVLICLIVWYFTHIEILLTILTGLLIANMVVPQIYRPVAKLWLGFSNVLGTVMSKILLSIIFYFLVTPVGIFRRITGNDSLQLKKWKKSRTSVFQIRDYKYQQKDIDKPY